MVWQNYFRPCFIKQSHIKGFISPTTCLVLKHQTEQDTRQPKLSSQEGHRTPLPTLPTKKYSLTMTAYKILGISSAIVPIEQDQQQQHQEQPGNQAQVPETPPSPNTPVQSTPSPSSTIPTASRDPVHWSSASNPDNCFCGLCANVCIHDDYILDHEALDDPEDLDNDDDDSDDDGDDESTWSWSLLNTSQGGEYFAPHSDDDDDAFDFEDIADHEGQDKEDDEDPSYHQHGHQLEQGTFILDSWTFGG